MSIRTTTRTKVVPPAEAADTLCVARSRPNQMIFFLLVAATCGASFLFDLLVFGRFGLVTIVFVSLTVWQGLRTYVMRTVFAADRVEHRTALGIWRGAEYSKMAAVKGEDESIAIIGEDLVGKTLEFRLLKRDANLEEVAAFLRGRNVLRTADHG